MTGCDAILEQKLALCKSISEGLPRHLKLKLKIHAIEEAQAESGADYEPVLAILRQAAGYRVAGAIAQEDVSPVLTAIRNTDGVGFYEGGYLYIHPDRFQQITDMLRVSRKHVLREMAGLGLLRLMTGDYPHFTYRVQRKGKRDRYVAIKWNDDMPDSLFTPPADRPRLEDFAAQMFGLLKQCGALIDECASEPTAGTCKRFLELGSEISGLIGKIKTMEGQEDVSY